MNKHDSLILRSFGNKTQREPSLVDRCVVTARCQNVNLYIFLSPWFCADLDSPLFFIYFFNDSMYFTGFQEYFITHRRVHSHAQALDVGVGVGVGVGPMPSY